MSVISRAGEAIVGLRDFRIGSSTMDIAICRESYGLSDILLISYPSVILDSFNLLSFNSKLWVQMRYYTSLILKKKNPPHGIYYQSHGPLVPEVRCVCQSYTDTGCIPPHDYLTWTRNSEEIAPADYAMHLAKGMTSRWQSISLLHRTCVLNGPMTRGSTKWW